ncbi:MAG TPA: hypothetical protein VFV73_17695 [Streptosporangiaceae bacterium]|nr:hypothetical protein [Streptosporangiaceae bacterium]
MACSSSSHTARSYSRRPMAAISSTPSGTQATSRRNHSYRSRPTGTAGGSSASRPASHPPNCSRAPPASAAAEASSAAADGSSAARAWAQASTRPAMPSSSATASAANSRAGARSATGAWARIPGTARSCLITVAILAASAPGGSSASKTGPSAWSVQNRGMPRTRTTSLSHSTRAIADRSRRWSTRSGTSAGRIRASSAANVPSSSRRCTARAASTSGRQP